MAETRGQDAFHARANALRPPAAMSLLRSAWPLAACLVLAILLQLVIRPILPVFAAKMLLDIGTSIILAVSLTMVNGFTGQFSIGHAAFMAVGAYVSATIVYYGSFRLFGDANMNGGMLSGMIGSRGSVPLIRGSDLLFLGSLLAGGIAAAGCGYLVGLPSLRLKGDYLAIVTLGFGEIVRVLIQSQTTEVLWDAEKIAATPAYLLPKYSGGALGFSGLPFYSSLFWVWVFAGLTLLVAVRLKYSSTGRAFLAIREDEVAAEAMGVPTTKYKVRAFVIAAFFAGIAGGLFAHTVGVQLNPGELGFLKSFDILIMVVLGGLGSISGAALAATILTILPELLRQPPSIWPLGLVAGVLIAAVLTPFSQKRWKPAVTIAAILIAWEIMRWTARTLGVDLAGYRMVIYAVALVLMMILRPEGLLGIREIWELRPVRSGAKGGKGARR
jgi:branched-chain amino acid transport system permease protein